MALLKQRKRMTLVQQSSWKGRLFVLPFYIGFFVFFLFPLLQSLSFSFSTVNVSPEGFTSTFTKLENLRFIFREDPTYGTLLVSTISSLFWKVPTILIISLFIAVILKSRFVGRTFIRGVFFLPVVLASGMVLMIVRGDAVANSMLAGNTVSAGTIVESSMLDTFLVDLGLGPQIVAVISLIYENLFSLLWRAGIQIIIFLAALQSVPASLYEASAVEGTTAWEDFWKITIPIIKPMILLNTFFTIIETFMDSQNALMNKKVMVAFGNPNTLGLASAMAWTYFAAITVILAVIALVFRKISKDD